MCYFRRYRRIKLSSYDADADGTLDYVAYHIHDPDAKAYQLMGELANIMF